MRFLIVLTTVLMLGFNYTPYESCESKVREWEERYFDLLLKLQETQARLNKLESYSSPEPQVYTIEPNRPQQLQTIVCEYNRRNEYECHEID